MKPDPSKLDRDKFHFRDCVIAGDEAWLIFPKEIEAEWTVDTLMFRSIILRKTDNKVISLGQLKFFNYGQSPSLYPDPTQFNDWRISTKLDGSLCIVSRHNGELIVRTRGTTSVDQHDTGPEIMELVKKLNIDKHPVLEHNSVLFEHTSPNNQIVLAYLTPELTLLDVVDHETCTYWNPIAVDLLAIELRTKRPDTHQFTTIEEMSQLLKTVKNFEGYVLAYNNHRNRVKLKAEEYLLRHRFMSRVSLPNLLDIWFDKGCPDLLEFKRLIQLDYDYECMALAEPLATQICEACLAVKIDLALIENKVIPLRTLSRRDAALWIQTHITQTHQGVAFTMLSNDRPNEKQRRKLMELELDI